MSMSSPSIGSLKDAIKALQALPDAFRQRAAQIESIYKSQPEVKRLCGEKRAGAAPSTTYDKAQSETVNQIKLLQNTISAVSNSLLELWSSSQTSIAHADEHSRLLALVIMFNYQTINTKTYSSTLEFFGGETRKKMVRSRKMVPHQDVKEKLAKSPELNLDLCATESYGSTIHFNDRERERGVRHHDNSISKSQLGSSRRSITLTVDIFDENPAAAANAIGNVATMSMGKLSTTSASTSILAKRVPGPPPKMKAVAMAVAATSSPMMGRATPQDAVACNDPIT